MTARATFKQDDVSRAVKGVVAALGPQDQMRIEVSPVDGRIIITLGDGSGATPRTNPWDEEIADGR